MKQIGDYEFDQRESNFLGKGAYGSVYLGHKINDPDKIVAVKFIRDTRDSTVSYTVGREVEVLLKLHHPNIVRLYEHEVESNGVYLVMEFCNGGDLSEYLREKGKLKEETIRYFLKQVLSALYSMKQKDVLHRDLKPANIMISHCLNCGKKSHELPVEKITFKIADFGLARQLLQGEMAATICGSPIYMAPEILLRQKYDGAVDVWSLGVITYECLTSEPPFPVRGLTNFYRNHPRLKPRIPHTTSPSLADLLRRMLTYDPISRITLREICRHPFIRDGTAVSTPDLFTACTNKGKLAEENPYLHIYPIPRLADRHRGLKLENSPIHRKRDEPPRRIDYNEKLLHMDLGFSPEFKGNKKWENFNEDRPDRFRKRGYAGQLNEGLFVKRNNEETGNLEGNQRRKPGGRVLGGNFYSPQLGHRNPAEYRKLVLEHKPRFPLAKDVGGYVPRNQRFLPDKRPEVPYLRRKFSEPNLYFPSDSPTPPLDLDRISPASPGKYNNVDGPRAGSPETDQNKSPVQSKLPGAQIFRRKPSLGSEGLLCKPITSSKDDALKVEDKDNLAILKEETRVAQTAEHEPVGELEGIETLEITSKNEHSGQNTDTIVNINERTLVGTNTSNADCADPTKEPSDFVPPLIVDGDRLKLEIALEWCELVQEMVDQENQTLTSSSHFTNPKNPKKLEDTGMVTQWVKKRKMICKFMATSLKQMFEERKTTSSDKSKLSSSAIIAALLKDLEKYRKRFESQAQSVIISTSPAGSEATAEVLIFERALSLHESATTAEFLGKSLEALKHLRKAIILAYGTLQYSKVLGGDNITFGTIQKWKKHFNELAYTKQMVNGVNSPKCAENDAQDCILRPIMLPIIPNNDRMKDH